MVTRLCGAISLVGTTLLGTTAPAGSLESETRIVKTVDGTMSLTPAQTVRRS